MIEPLTEYVANKTVRVTYADGNVHNFLVIWNNNILNVIWDNHSVGMVSINGYRINELLEEESFSQEEILRLEFILKDYLTTKE
jgi:hypothetical protein